MTSDSRNADWARRLCLAIAVHNRLSFTRNCLLSLRRQTVGMSCIIVVDGGSTDETAALHGMPERVPVSEITPTVLSPLCRNLKAGDRIDPSRYGRRAGFRIRGASLPQCHRHQSLRAQRAVVIEFHAPDRGCELPRGRSTRPPRDYIHASDLAEVHILSGRYLREGGSKAVLNLGKDRGFSTREVLEIVHRVTGREFPVCIAPRWHRKKLRSVIPGSF